MSEIRAGTTTTTALVSTGDTTGNIVLTPDSGIATISATGALTVPSGTTAQRPATPVAGMTRWNTTLGAYEVYAGTTWVTLASTPYTVDYLVVAGGGGGGYDYAGGGGAGGYLASTLSVSSPTTYTVTIGAGGAGGINSTGSKKGFSGSNSVFSSITAPLSELTVDAIAFP